MKEAIKLALEALELAHPRFGIATEKHKQAITAIKAALAQPQQPKVRTGDCLLVGVCASEGHNIQVKQEPWRESASDYERGVIDGRQMQAQSSVDKAVNRMAQPEQEPVAWWNDTGTHIDLNVSGRGTPLYTTPPQPEERNFCSRCGKRTADLTVIHTCTPPQEKNT